MIRELSDTEVALVTGGGIIHDAGKWVGRVARHAYYDLEEKARALGFFLD
ncbi:hypothetical protein [Kordiimonas laminariae]|nr:hypothetical protein [Kordiimonas laminariae]MCK0069469.1 hypothetical protein [Kordiimonas laminariae]